MKTFIQTLFALAFLVLVLCLPSRGQTAVGLNIEWKPPHTRYERNDTTYMWLNKKSFVARVDSVYSNDYGSVQVDSITHFFMLNCCLLRKESFSKEYYIKEGDDLDVLSVSNGMLPNKKYFLTDFEKLILVY